MSAWRYGTAIHEENGDFVVSIRDLPEVVTSGATLDEALELAADAIVVTVEGRMDDDMELPEPSRVRKGEHGISLPAQLAAKASVIPPGRRLVSARPSWLAVWSATKSKCAESSTPGTAPSWINSTKRRVPSADV
jgi:predicted RNase H-like HicB family nuclease